MAASENSDEQLLGLIAQRDVDALAALYDRHAQTIYNVIVRIVRDQPLADEVLQDTFWQVWQKAADFQRGGVAAAWLYRIARNKSLDQLRRQKSRPQPASLYGEDQGNSMASLPTTNPSVEQQTEQRWRQQSVRQALTSIPPEQRTCLELAYFEGLSQREIAEQMGTPLGTVKTRIRIGLTKLARTLRGAGLEAEDVS